MSTVKANNVQALSASAANIALNADGTVSGPGGSVMYAGGRNRIINGGFDVWQRGTSFTNPLGSYTADRWSVTGAESASVASQQAFTPGNAIPGYEPTYFYRLAKNGTTANQFYISQRIEDVRTFAGQTVTMSYWMKASATITNEPLFQQNFGTGGSSEVYTTTTTHSVTTSWQRYSVTLTIPAISGKTIGANSFLAAWPMRYVGTANVTVDIWGVQVEAGSVATPFEVKPYAQELRECQRYFQYVAQGTGGADQPAGVGMYNSSTSIVVLVPLKQEMRAAPSLIATTGTNYYYFASNGADYMTSLTAGNMTPQTATLTNTTEVSGTAGQGGILYASFNGARISLSAEL